MRLRQHLHLPPLRHRGVGDGPDSNHPGRVAADKYPGRTRQRQRAHVAGAESAHYLEQVHVPHLRKPCKSNARAMQEQT
eukprot:3091984-Pyramimonas_sp.AAC.1